MNPITQYAIAGFLNSFICCSAIAFLVSKWKGLKSIVKVGITYAVYVLLAFVMSAGGNGLFNIDMSVFNLTLFLFYCAGGICSCILVYVFLEREALGVKAKKGKK
ncbi:MAG: hypothetical protein IJ362_08455 [Oscillospiraceae bacterium]|nr:hypothetical protein [Oscillospiraceae bacterium]